MQLTDEKKARLWGLVGSQRSRLQDGDFECEHLAEEYSNELGMDIRACHVKTALRINKIRLRKQKNSGNIMKSVFSRQDALLSAVSALGRCCSQAGVRLPEDWHETLDSCTRNSQEGLPAHYYVAGDGEVSQKELNRELRDIQS